MSARRAACPLAEVTAVKAGVGTPWRGAGANEGGTSLTAADASERQPGAPAGFARKVGRRRAEVSRVSAAVPAETLEAARLGAGWAFEGIYRALAGPVRRFVAAQGACDPDATTQDVFLRVLGGLGRFDGDADHLRSWVFTVARNRLVDEHRAAARRPVAAAEAAPDRPAPGTEDDVVAGLDARRIHAVLDTLPDEQREVVVLRFLSDLPLSEVAAVVGRSLPAVKALQHRGVARLRRQLQDLAPQPASFPAVPTFTSV